jgi:F-type H+-transporting ATPase subunit b
MPQIQQLPYIYASQIFWLLVVFGIVFFGIGLGMLPKIRTTVESRDRRITDDLAGAERARAAADETEAAWRMRTEAARAEAMKVTAAAKQDRAREMEAKVKTADSEAGAKIDAAEARIRAAAEAALGEIEAVAAEAAQEMAAKLAGINVSRDRAAEAVKAALNG